ncbi:MAG: RDD family protein [Buchananella hordeovulneris]|nr:RDD family protein [Buchananella hordeovulneris]
MESSSPIAGRVIERDVLVTGEAVEIEVAASSPFSRAVAGTIDAVVLFSCAIMTLVLMQRYYTPDNSAEMRAVFISMVVFFALIAPVTIEWLTKGRSVGKLAMGLQVVRDDGGPIAFRHSMVRGVTNMIEGWLTLGAVAFVFMVASPRSKRGGDLLAGTHVVTTGSRASAPLPFLAPPELAEWMTLVDVRRLPPQLTVAVRRFLLNATTMDPASRMAMGQRLASQCEPLVSPPPPWGTHPERFLVALSCARRDREYALRLRGQAQREAEISASMADVASGR